MRSSAILVLALALAPAAHALAVEPAEVVLSGGRIFTIDPVQPWAEAVAIRAGRIVYVGDEKGAQAFVGPKTRRALLGGRLVLPAFVDSHTHPGLVTSSAEVFLLPHTDDPREIVKAVGDEARKHPERKLLVGGYWPIAAFPTSGPRREDLDAVVPDRPVVLFDDSGHSQWLNSRALQLMGIDRTTKDPVPGLSSFARDKAGVPTGWAREMAAIPYLRKIGLLSKVDPEEMHAFLEYLVSRGVTTVFDAGNDDRDEAVYAVVSRLAREGRLPLRYEGSVHITLPEQVPLAIARLERLRERYTAPRLHFGTVKIHFDGVSEIGTSSVLEPFLTDPTSRGNTLLSREGLRDFLLELQARDIDLHLHTVGDGAVRTALNAVEQARAAVGGPLRSRVTLCHIELVSDADVPRFARLGVVASFTPHWNGGYFAGADRFLGRERYDRMYRVRPFLEAGATVSFSSDITDHIEWKTDRADPFFGLQVGHNRQEPEGGVSAPIRPPAAERLDLADLLRGYTLGGAYQLRMEDRLGSIAVGKSADLMMLDQNLFQVDRYALREVRPRAVLMEGRVVSGALP